MRGNRIKNTFKKLFYILANPKSYFRAKSVISELKKKNEEIVFIVTCGPSLEKVKNIPGLKKVLGKNYLICLKQAYNDFQSEVDLHIVNEIRYAEYNYEYSRPLILSVGKKNCNLVSDAHFPIIDYCQSQATFFTNNYEGASLLNKPFFRPWGIGLMYELALFIPQLINCKKLIIIGFDMNKEGKYHFYDKEDENDAQSYKVDDQEISLNHGTIPHLEIWLNKQNIDVALFSPLSSLPFTKKISTISELSEFVAE